MGLKYHLMSVYAEVILLCPPLHPSKWYIMLLLWMWPLGYMLGISWLSVALLRTLINKLFSVKLLHFPGFYAMACEQEQEITVESCVDQRPWEKVNIYSEHHKDNGDIFLCRSRNLFNVLICCWIIKGSLQRCYCGIENSCFKWTGKAATPYMDRLQASILFIAQ